MSVSILLAIPLLILLWHIESFCSLFHDRLQCIRLNPPLFAFGLLSFLIVLFSFDRSTGILECSRSILVNCWLNVSVQILLAIHCKNKRVVLAPSSHFYSFAIRVVSIFCNSRFDSCFGSIPPLLSVIGLFVESPYLELTKLSCTTLRMEWVDSLRSRCMDRCRYHMAWVYQIAVLPFK